MLILFYLTFKRYKYKIDVKLLVLNAIKNKIKCLMFCNIWHFFVLFILLLYKNSLLKIKGDYCCAKLIII